MSNEANRIVRNRLWLVISLCVILVWFIISWEFLFISINIGKENHEKSDAKEVICKVNKFLSIFQYFHLALHPIEELEIYVRKKYIKIIYNVCMRNVMASVIYCSFHLAITDCKKKLHSSRSQPHHIHPVHSRQWMEKNVCVRSSLVDFFPLSHNEQKLIFSVLIKFHIGFVCSRFLLFAFLWFMSSPHSVYGNILAANKIHNKQFQLMND